MAWYLAKQRNKFTFLQLFRTDYPMGTGGYFCGVKRQRREADQSPPSSAEVKNALSYTCSPPPQPVTTPWRGAHLSTWTLPSPLFTDIRSRAVSSSTV